MTALVLEFAVFNIMLIPFRQEENHLRSKYGKSVFGNVSLGLPLHCCFEGGVSLGTPGHKTNRSHEREHAS